MFLIVVFLFIVTISARCNLRTSVTTPMVIHTQAIISALCPRHLDGRYAPPVLVRLAYTAAILKVQNDLFEATRHGDDSAAVYRASCTSLSI
jgi:hypothetical protein